MEVEQPKSPRATADLHQLDRSAFIFIFFFSKLMGLLFKYKKMGLELK